MKLCRGDMWTAFHNADLFLITTNSFIRQDGGVVMGRGIAREAMSRFPALPRAAGEHIPHLGVYGLLPWRGWRGVPRQIGLFQVKVHWSDLAELWLVAYSTGMLRQHLQMWPTLNVHLNFPGIGNGKLLRSKVLPIIETLPDNVHVWEYGDE